MCNGRVLPSIALDMAQNVNPFVQTQTSSPKTSEETQSRANDGHAVSKRLQKELMILMMNSDKTVSAFPEGENLFKWIGTITGPEGTVFEGLVYKLSLEFPNSYPYSAPLVRFVTPCFHPNVDMIGNICLDILKEKWSALYDVRTILLSIQSLLGEPNNDSPLNPTAARLWCNQSEYQRTLHREYEKTVKKTIVGRKGCQVWKQCLDLFPPLFHGLKHRVWTTCKKLCQFMVDIKTMCNSQCSFG